MNTLQDTIVEQLVTPETQVVEVVETRVEQIGAEPVTEQISVAEIETLALTEPGVEHLGEVRVEEQLITECHQGPPGPPGPAGPAGATAITRSAGSTISANTVVYETQGEIHPLSHDDRDHIFAVLGLAVTTGQPGAQIVVQRSGSVSDAAWAWAYGRVYLGQDGRMTQDPPADGFSVLVGFAASPDTINLSISDPIEV